MKNILATVFLSMSCISLGVMSSGCGKKSEDATGSGDSQTSTDGAPSTDPPGVRANGGPATRQAEPSGRAQPGSTGAPAANGAAQAPANAANPMAAATEELAASGFVNPKAKVVGWRDLVPFLPDEIAGFTAVDELDGRTTKMAGAKITEAERRYKLGNARASIKLMDASAVPTMQQAATYFNLVDEDSSDGFKKPAKVKGHPGSIEWAKKRKKSSLNAYIGNRFLLTVDVRDTPDDMAAFKIAEAMEIAKLANLP